MNCGAVRNRIQSSIILALFGCALICNPLKVSLVLGGEQSPRSTVDASIDAAIGKLGSAAYLERESASRELMQRGAVAIPKLAETLPAAKGEVRYRIRSILDAQRGSADLTTRQAVNQALVRIAVSKDRASSSWARTLLRSPGIPADEPVATQSPAPKQG